MYVDQIKTLLTDVLSLGDAGAAMNADTPLLGALPELDPAKPLVINAAMSHLTAAVPHVAGDYMGEHWLATFAMLALTNG